MWLIENHSVLLFILIIHIIRSEFSDINYISYLIILQYCIIYNILNEVLLHAIYLYK